MPVLELAPGALFARDYKVERALASGGMGAVYVVEQLSTGVRRALKIMRGELVADDKSRQRFDQEARLGALIASEHIVKVIQAGVDEASATPWLCMELLVGEDLATALARRDRMTHAETAALFEQACHALELAHRIPIVHRDLKPENLFLSQPLGPGVPFSVKILDLGIAKLIQESQGATAPTASLGTPLWMAPEQTDPNGEVSPATDVWALGLIAFRVLTGRHFWRAANAAHPTLTMVLAEVLSAEIPSATERAAELGARDALPAGFDAWFARCVVRPQASRFAHAGAARDALLPLLGAAPPERRDIGLDSTVAHVPDSSVLPAPALTAPRPRPDDATAARPIAPKRWPWLVGAGVAVPLLAVAAGLSVDRAARPTADAPAAQSGASSPAALAAILRAEAAVDAFGAGREGCLATLERADELDPKGADLVPADVRAFCEMAGRRCAEGRVRYRKFVETDPRVPSVSVDAMVRTVAARTCAPSEWDDSERVTAINGFIADAWSKGDAEVCLLRGAELVELFPTLKSKDGNDEMTREVALAALTVSVMCAAKAGRCREALGIHRHYYRFAPYLSRMPPEQVNTSFVSTNPQCASALTARP